MLQLGPAKSEERRGRCGDDFFLLLVGFAASVRFFLGLLGASSTYQAAAGRAMTAAALAMVSIGGKLMSLASSAVLHHTDEREDRFGCRLTAAKRLLSETASALRR